MTRIFDVILSLAGLVIGAPVLALLWLLGLLDSGLPVFRQERVGRNQKPFILVKFRTMRPNTASVATHLADASSVTKLGYFLRRTKLDELPQLWNVLKGDMSLVGPRPCLFNQAELIELRAQRGIFAVRPGITGSAQIMGIDMSNPLLLVEMEAEMLMKMSMKLYFILLFRTLTGAGVGDRVRGPSNGS